MRILITGVTGFLGRHLAASMLADGHDVSGCGIAGGGTVAGVEVTEIDLLDAAGLEALVRRIQPAAVFHFGGLSHVGASFDRPGDYFRVNVLGTRNLLDALRTSSPDEAAIAPLIFASSAEVYGAVPEAEQPIVEGRHPAPRSPYAWSKAAAEQLVLAADGIVVRAFNIIGPGQAPTFALPSFAQQLARAAAGRAEPRLQVGDLSPERDFVHVDDAIAAYRTVLLSGSRGEIFNLATGRARSIRTLLDRLCSTAGLEVEVSQDPSRVRPVDVPLIRGDYGRLSAQGWRPERTVDEAIQALWDEARTREATR